MKIITPSIDDITNHFWDKGQCSILLKNDQSITGVFTRQNKPEGKIIGWWVYVVHGAEMYVPHDQIAWIENEV